MNAPLWKKVTKHCLQRIYINKQICYKVQMTEKGQNKVVDWFLRLGMIFRIIDDL